jgi:hypothetical protein
LKPLHSAAPPSSTQTTGWDGGLEEGVGTAALMVMVGAQHGQLECARVLLTAGRRGHAGSRRKYYPGEGASDASTIAVLDASTIQNNWNKCVL